MKPWSEYTLERHAAFAIGLLVAGTLIGFVNFWAGRTNAAFMIVLVFAGAAAGTLEQLRRRLVVIPTATVPPE